LPNIVGCAILLTDAAGVSVGDGENWRQSRQGLQKWNRLLPKAGSIAFDATLLSDPYLFDKML
jgi:hypothetical protein